MSLVMSTRRRNTSEKEAKICQKGEAAEKKHEPRGYCLDRGAV